MINLKISSLILAGLLSAVSVATYAASNDGADATGTKSGSTGGSTMAPNNTTGAPAAGSTSGSGSSGASSSSGTGTNTNGGTSGSGAGGGTGAAGGGTGGAGGGTGS